MANNTSLTEYDYEYDYIYYYDGNNTCEENQSAQFEFLDSIQNGHIQTGILVSYLVTMAVGLFGNSLVIYVIARHAQIRNKSVANYYIWNLAFADLFFVLTMPLFCYATFGGEWPFGTPICKLSKVFHETNRYASMFTLVALSFDRYLASFYNMGHLRTVKAGLITCCVIWVLCGTISIPYWIYSTADDNQCRTNLPSSFLEIWVYIQLTIALLIPIFLICISYVLLAMRLRIIMGSSTVKTGSVQKPNKKLIRTILVVVVIFLICQVPWHAHEIIALAKHHKYNDSHCMPSIFEMKLSMYMSTIATILGFVSSCCNPIIYGILNANYRKQYGTVLCCCIRSCGCEDRSTSVNNNTQGSGSGGLRSCFQSSCYKRDGESRGSGRHYALSDVSQDGTVYRTVATQHVELEDAEEKC